MTGPEALALFRGLLGVSAYFVPCVPGTKRPKVTYVERPKEKTFTEAYLALFEEANIAVYLGEQSDGLCAIDFDREQDVATFLKCNPALGMSTRSRGSRGAIIWLRIQGAYPASMDGYAPAEGKVYEWRANKRLATIWGRHPSGCEYQLLCSEPPAEVPFDQIVWPEGWPVPGKLTPQEELEAQYGPAFAMSEKGAVRWNQEALVAKFVREHDVLFNPDTSRFYRYEGDTGLWKHEPRAALSHQFGEDLRRMIAEAKAAAGGDVRFDGAHFGITAALKGALVESLQGFCLSRCPFEREPGIIHVGNGMLDLTGKEPMLRPFGKEWHSRNQCPIRYDPKARPRRFLSELLMPAMPEDDIDLLQRWMGLALLGDNSCQVMLVLTGNAGTGKGAIAGVTRLLVGQQNCYQLRPEHLASRFEISHYFDKTLLYGPDVDPKFLDTPAAHMLKSLTGGDLLSGEIKGGMNSYTLKGNFNVMITSNARLLVRLNSDSGAWARRLMFISFDGPPVEKRVDSFHDVLMREEGPGILAWAVEGAMRTLANMAAGTPFPLSARQRRLVEDIINESDSLREFITAGVQRSGFPTDQVTTEALHTAYLEFCEQRNWTPVATRTFQVRSAELMSEIHRALPSNHVGQDERGKGGKRGYQGVILTEY